MNLYPYVLTSPNSFERMPEFMRRYIQASATLHEINDRRGFNAVSVMRMNIVWGMNSERFERVPKWREGSTKDRRGHTACYWGHVQMWRQALAEHDDDFDQRSDAGPRYAGGGPTENDAALAADSRPSLVGDGSLYALTAPATNGSGYDRSAARPARIASPGSGSAAIFFEDDAWLDQDFWPRAFQGYDELPDDWDVLYFGGQHCVNGRRMPPVASEHLYRLGNVNRLHAYSIRLSSLPKIILWFSENHDWGHNFHDPKTGKAEAEVDYALGSLTESGFLNGYALRNWACSQGAFFSWTQGVEEKERRFQP